MRAEKARNHASGARPTLVPSQVGNRNAVKHGVHSERVLAERAESLREILRAELRPGPRLEFALHEVARLGAIIDAIDRDLDERGLTDRNGKARYLVELRVRTSRQFERWHDKLLDGCPRAEVVPQLEGEGSDYVAELQRIALRDQAGSTRDRLTALKALLALGRRGTASGALVLEEQRAGLPWVGDLVGRAFEKRAGTWVELESGVGNELDDEAQA